MLMNRDFTDLSQYCLTVSDEISFQFIFCPQNIIISLLCQNLLVKLTASAYIDETVHQPSDVFLKFKKYFRYASLLESN